VITCVVEYVIDPAKIDAFERFARRWMELVNLHGGTHHGYFLPAEGASDRFAYPGLPGEVQLLWWKALAPRSETEFG